MSYSRAGWAEESLRRRATDLQMAAPGGRHLSCWQAGADVGPYIAAGVLDEETAVRALVAAAVSAGKKAKEAERTIRDGIAKGLEQEPWWPSSSFGGREEVVSWGGKVLRMPSAQRTAVQQAEGEGEARRAAGRPLREVDLSGIVLPVVQQHATTIEISRFGSVKQPQGGREELAWYRLVEEVGDPVPWPEGGKKMLPLWSPTLLEGDSRAKGSVTECVTALVLDYDDDDDWSVDKVAEEWWPEVRHISHTSASHRVEKVTGTGTVHPAIPRGRVVVALSRPVSLEEHEQIAEWVLQAGRGTPGATELRSTARAYYAPAEAPGGYAHGHHDPGAVVDVDALLGAIRRAVEGEADEVVSAAREGQPLVVKVQGGASGWFVLREHGYTAVDGPLLRVELERSHDVSTSVPVGDEGRTRSMKPDELYASYGQRADRLVYSMVEGSAGFEADEHTGGGTLTLQVCRVDPKLTPQYHADVDEWLDRLVGVQADRLRDWLACCMDLSRPIAALYLQGSDSVGKGMLAGALGRLYGRSTVSYSDVLGGFNSALKTSPIVYLDERAPKMANGSAGFRTLVGDSSRQLTEKYQPTATLIGCPRLVVAANNSDALRLSEEDLERADEEAIALRILHLMVEPRCKAWLTEKGGRAGHTFDWVETPQGGPGKLCQHIAWLRENWTVTRPGTRFLVEGDAEAWLRAAGTRAGLPQRVLVAIATAAAGADHPWDERERPILYKAGVAWVRPKQLQNHWADLTGESRPPSVNRLGEALGRLGAPPNRAVSAPWGKRIRARPVDATHVVGVAEDLCIGDGNAVAIRFSMTGSALPEDDQ